MAARLLTEASLPSLVTLAGIGAPLTATINNLPVILVLLTAPRSASAAGLVLAMLIGVNIGSNLDLQRSLALLLWRLVLRRHGYRTEMGRFSTLGLIPVPPGLGSVRPACGGMLQP